MKISTVSMLCWVTSIAAAAGLGASVLDFRGRQEALRRPFDEATVADILKSGVEVVETRRSIVDYNQQVRPHWINMNWTGKPPEKIVERAPETAPTKPTYEPVSQILSVLYVQVDVVDPGRSMIFVRYKKGGLQGTTDDVAQGEALAAPHDKIFVHNIQPDRVVFAFPEDADRAEETLVPGPGDGEPLIHVVGEEGIVKPEQRPLPAFQRPVAQVPEQTRLVAQNRWELGTADMEEFGRDYQRILTQDVSTRTHFDRDGNRAGVEITKVTPGSLAARHGVVEGDIVISINGNPVSSEQEAIKYVKNNQDNFTEWVVVIENMGRRTTKVYRSPDQD